LSNACALFIGSVAEEPMKNRKKATSAQKSVCGLKSESRPSSGSLPVARLEVARNPLSFSHY
jgi:hypothetical protein